MKNSILIVFFLFACSFSFSQESTPIKGKFALDGKNFKLVNEFYVYGDSKAIGNTILSTHRTKPFNDMEVNNDDVEMVYVDVDDDDETFSSSIAELNLPENHKNISYAGLYWSATYNSEKGTRKKEFNDYIYEGNGKRESFVERIKFKTPNAEYQDIEGDVIYNGIENPTHAINSPYVCYADVTELLNTAREVNGEYAVANVRASNGYLSGGSAGGWMLYVIYQSPTEKPKYITTFNGFAMINKEPVDVKYDNFKGLNQGHAKTEITLSALEGDLSLFEDGCSIVRKDKSFYPLSNGTTRSQYNFFNSSITENNDYSLKRIPNSKNTLGFDIASIAVPNFENDIIDNDATRTTLRFKTKSDRYYLFFTAFKTEESQIPPKPELVERNTTTIVKHKDNKLVEAPKNRKRASIGKRTKRKGFDSKEFKKLANQESTWIPDLKGGYYVITNVFTDAMSAGKWETTLITKGYKPKTFVDAKTKKRYVYVLQTESAKEAFTKQQDLIEDRLYRDTWILKVNLH